MDNNKKSEKGLLGVITVICAGLIALSIILPDAAGPAGAAVKFLVTPLQRSLNSFGSYLSGLSTNLESSATLQEKNKALQEKVDTLTAENSKLVLDKEELARLQTLLELKNEYSDYDTVGANVISRGSGNWYSTFTIDKGTDDGIQVDCNVMAGAGLVGIVTKTGRNWSLVRSIIDDNSNVSAMVSTTSDTCIVAGNLQLIDQGTLSLVKLLDDNDHVHVGDKVVTSNISEKYLPGILIGYISELNNDANNLTKSGQLTPVVDFRHIQEVLVIRTLKNYIASTDDAENDKAARAEAAAEAAGASESIESETGESSDAQNADDGSTGAGEDPASDENAAGSQDAGAEAVEAGQEDAPAGGQ